MSEGAGFSDLVQQAGRLTTDMDTSAELPRVERNLKQLLEAGAQDVKASILLGSRGVDLPAISQRLESLDASRTFQPLEPVKDTDIAGFLRNERENAVLTVIEQSRKQTFDEVDRFHWEAFQSCWELEKQRILSTLATSEQGLLNDTIQPEELAYAGAVGDYVKQKTQDGSLPDLGRLCRDAMTELKDDVAEELWDTLRCVTEAEVRAQVDRFSGKVQAALIDRAKRHLETR
ncbi:nuclear pore complex protein Nup93-like [Pollicipes pollicipes]|uniref:nuclear pore complex protein Nup93-like n=1 Tax=Pollicipes pollicipes TaxID=41117 RepID=UPI0018854862|nr:nuclear pore complex protein Nup93-like [Pollicipes pollicipes]